MSPPPAVVTESADGQPEQPPVTAIAEELEKKLQVKTILRRFVTVFTS